MNTNNITITSVIQNILNQATISWMVFGTISPFYQSSNAKKYAYGVSAELAPQIGLSVPYYGSVTLGLNLEFIAASVPIKMKGLRFKKEVTDKMSALSQIGKFTDNDFKVESKEEVASAYFSESKPNLTLSSGINSFHRELSDSNYTSDTHKAFVKEFNDKYATSADTYHVIYASTKKDYDTAFKSINDNTNTDTDLLNPSLDKKNIFFNRTGSTTTLSDIQFRPMKIEIKEVEEVTSKVDFEAFISSLIELKNVSEAINNYASSKGGAIIGFHGFKISDVADITYKNSSKEVSDVVKELKLVEADITSTQLTDVQKTEKIDNFVKQHGSVNADMKLLDSVITAQQSLLASDFANGDRIVKIKTYKANSIEAEEFDNKAKTVISTLVTEYFNKDDSLKVKVSEKTEKFSADNLNDWVTTLSKTTVNVIYPDAKVKYFNDNDTVLKTGVTSKAISSIVYELTDVDSSRITLLANMYRGFSVNVYANLSGSKYINGIGIHGFVSLQNWIKTTFVEKYSTYNLWSNQQNERKTTKVDFATAKELSNTIDSNSSIFKTKYYEVATADSSAGNSVKTLEESDFVKISENDISKSWSEVQNISLNSHKIGFSIFPIFLNGDSIRFQFTFPSINSASDAKLFKCGYNKTLYGNPLANDTVTIAIAEYSDFDGVETNQQI